MRPFFLTCKGLPTDSVGEPQNLAFRASDPGHDQPDNAELLDQADLLNVTSVGDPLETQGPWTPFRHFSKVEPHQFDFVGPEQPVLPENDPDDDDLDVFATPSCSSCRGGVQPRNAQVLLPRISAKG